MDKEVLSKCTKFLKDAVNTNLQPPIEYLHSFGESGFQITEVFNFIQSQAHKTRYQPGIMN